MPEGLSSVAIRPYRPEDLDALYRICLATGDAGKDAAPLFADPKLLGHIYAGPYALLSPKACFVVEDDEGVGGYIIGAVDTHAFEKKLETEWWPSLRSLYEEPRREEGREFDREARMRLLIHRPPRTPRRISQDHPSHLHINLLPRLQGRGWGKKLIDHWLAAMRRLGSPGAHLGVGTANSRAVRFYGAYGFREIDRAGPPFNVIWFGVSLR
jgi:ribosomal protein S18 acetylase RimI-like enzyme